jgi:histidinol-phosphate phosphatase family protein
VHLESSPKTPAIFFDRDGVINARILGGYVRHWNEFKLMEGVVETLAEIKRRGYLAIIITNQRGVGLGLMSDADLNTVHEEMQRAIEARAGVRFDDIFVCTDTDHSSTRRKPSPAMLLEAAQKWNIDLAKGWMIGDAMTDIEAGTRAGTKTAYLVTQHSEEAPKATKVIHSIEEILEFL